MVVKLAVAEEGDFDFAFQKALGLRMRQPLVAFGSVNVRLLAGNTKQLPDDFGRLTHIEFGDGIGEAALKTDDRLEIGWLRLQRGHNLRAKAASAGKPGKPAHTGLWPDQRRVA